jgi:hypothetical protein
MTTEEILEGNKLCAEFWGYNLVPSDTGWRYYFRGYKEHYMIQNHNHPVYKNNPHRILLKNMKFHSDWNWLISVITKCKKLDSVAYLGSDIQYNLKKLNIESTFEAVVQFIKWYNENNK